MYRIHLTCQECGRKFTVDSDTPEDDRVCPHPHGEQPTGRARVEHYNRLKDMHERGIMRRPELDGLFQ